MRTSIAVALAASILHAHPAAADQTPEQIQELVAPIAAYPDALVAQILAASTYTDQVMQADRWLQEHSSLPADRVRQEADKQSWDPSVRALTHFPSVLADMDKNLAWTTALGETYMNQQRAVLEAVQVMRRRAQGVGALESTPPRTNPRIDPWHVYGPAVMDYPGWLPTDGASIGGPGIALGIDFGIGDSGRLGWRVHVPRCDPHGCG